ncbi:hypothetical protein ACHAWF_006827, partial [Thalassiosira exigua]
MNVTRTGDSMKKQGHQYTNGTKLSMSDINSATDGHDLRPEIIGGEPSPIDAFPYLISLRGIFDSVEEHICGATLVSSRIALTAGHCFKPFGTFFPLDYLLFNKQNSADEFRIPICHQELGIGCDLSSKAYVVVHPDLDTELESYSDVALIFLPSEIKGIAPVLLNSDPSTPSKTGENVVAVGWGATQLNPDIYPDDLHNVTLEYIERTECQEIWGDEFFPNPISSDMMCVYSDGKSPCVADSGGPLLLHGPDGTKQIGIVSWGSENCIGMPGVFARVNSFLDWIQDAACDFLGGDFCGECHEVKISEIGSTDFEVDQLPAFIQTKIDSGALVWDRGMLRKPEKKKKPGKAPDSEAVPEIVGGGDPTPNSQPYQVSIGLKALQGFDWPNGHVCSGSLIASNAVLSSAYMFGNKVRPDHVEFNRRDLYSDPGVVRMYLKKSDIFLHPDYNPATLENNLALIFLPSPIFDIKPVKLHENPDIRPEETMKVNGWGSYFIEGPPSNLLRTIDVNYVPECIDPEFNIAPSMMCANPADERNGPCDYDWGNPLIKNTPEGDVLVGVFSTVSCRLYEKSPPCDPNEQILRVNITTDREPLETAWELTNLCTECAELNVGYGTKYLLPETSYVDEYCVPRNVEYVFTIYDSFGDGICCFWGFGSYEVQLDGILVAEGGAFGYEESTSFGENTGSCNPDKLCRPPRPRPDIYARISAGVDWIERTVE